MYGIASRSRRRVGACCAHRAQCVETEETTQTHCTHHSLSDDGQILCPIAACVNVKLSVKIVLLIYSGNRKHHAKVDFLKKLFLYLIFWFTLVGFALAQSVVYCHGGRIGFYQGDIRLLSDDMKALRPTIFPVVPRLLNRMYDKVKRPPSLNKKVALTKY